jgi:drug/metabolite transporter (DMT)-like permease
MSFLRTEVRIGLLAGLATGALWGFPFLAPRVNSAFAPETIALGRFVFYAIFSLIWLLPSFAKKSFRETYSRPSVLLVALFFGLIGNGLYYTLVCYSVQKVGIPPTSLIVGLIPLTVALAGVRTRDELRRSILPCALIGLGVFLLNHHLKSSVEGSARDLLAPVIALFLWSAFAILNSHYLKKHPEIIHSEWASWLGITSLISLWLVLAIFDNGIAFAQFALACTLKNRLFIVSCLILGFGSSWLANGLWNRASRLLPTSLLGQLIVFETIAALIYGFIYDGRLPLPSEAIAAVLMIAGVALGIRALAPSLDGIN